MSNIAVVAPKLSKLIPLLSSDRDGEVIAAVRAIDRTLKSAGLDLYDFAKAVTAPKTIVVYGGSDEPEPAPQPTSLRDIAVWLRTHVATRMNYKEQQFVSEMATRLTMGRQVSEKQQNWLRNIYYWYSGDVR
jgi:hypothetical protein